MTDRQLSVARGLLDRMTTARRLAAIDLLCSRELPAGPGGSAPSGAGTVPLLVDLTHPADPADAPHAGRGPDADHEEQLYADRDALAVPLTARFGEPDHLGLQGVFLRAAEPGEGIPEPWRSISSRAGDALVWRAPGRWLVLAVTRDGHGGAARLLAAATDVDPP
ncbi:hypothetical protein YW7DRAFT_03949 [Streptomyces sp. AmelKG-E11A]|nr:hypothetical protein YW7DRAFT_03949 [Streptomyces sp. AmelKG-E11A]